MADISLGYSFDDVLLVPALSEVLPGEATLKTTLTKDISLDLPIVSAAMDTVSEHELAIALAREGGMGVIHRACPIEEQAAMVAKVKRSESAVILKPHTVTLEDSIQHVRQVMETNGFSGFPVVDDKGILVGMVTGRDIRYLDREDALVHEVMTPKEKLVTAAPNTSHAEARQILYQNRIFCHCPGNTERHGNAMISLAVHFTSSELTALNTHSVFVFLNLDTQRPQSVDGAADSVALLDP